MGPLTWALVALLDITLVGAVAQPRPPFAEGWDAWGEARLRAAHRTALSLDAAGTTEPAADTLTSRLRAGGWLEPAVTLRLTLEIEALAGLAAGDTTDLGTARGDDTFRRRRDTQWGAAILRPRLAYLTWDTGVGRLTAGQQAFLWGTGLLAHDGVAESDFGDAWQGNLVERVAFGTRPIDALTVFIGADLVFSDDNADLLEGDRALGAVLGARLELGALHLGLLQSFRWQRDRADDLRPDGERTTLRVWASDLYARLALDAVTLEAEGALLVGHTDRPYLEETFEDGADVRAYGGVVRARYDHQPWFFTGKLELGFASGDNDPRDDVYRAFAFNTDYDVGLLLFDQVLPLLSARSIDRLHDPALLQTPPSGTRFAVHQGAVTNAFYAFPRLLWRPIRPLDLRLGYLVAVAPADVVDPYQSAIDGGFNSTYGGASPGGRFLGQELDAAVRYTWPVWGALSFTAGAEAAAFFPGGAFDDLDLGTVYLARGLGALTW